MVAAHNPFGLTPGEARAVDAMITAGCRKAAATLLDLSVHTMNDHLAAARCKMQKRHTLHVVIEWDRWARVQAQGD